MSMFFAWIKDKFEPLPSPKNRERQIKVSAMMRIARLMGLLSVIGFALVGSKAWAQEVGNPQVGLALARRICSECHAVQSQQDHSPNPTAPHFVYIANVPGMTAIALSVALQKSHRTMPNIILDANETRDIIRYILNLQRTN